MSAPDNAGRVDSRPSSFPTTRQRSPSPPVSLTDHHLAEALANSPDNGATLDFTHKRLADVGEDGAERLATAGRSESSTDAVQITRSVFSCHRAPRQLNTIPESHSATTASQLSQQRLRSCHVYVISTSRTIAFLSSRTSSVSPSPCYFHRPHALQLTAIPSLEILDISRNKIKRLPVQPASLSNLRVRALH